MRVRAMRCVVCALDMKHSAEDRQRCAARAFDTAGGAREQKQQWTGDAGTYAAGGGTAGLAVGEVMACEGHALLPRPALRGRRRRLGFHGFRGLGGQSGALGLRDACGARGRGGVAGGGGGADGEDADGVDECHEEE